MNKDDLQVVEDRFKMLTHKLNVVYRKMTENMVGGMNYLHQNLHGLATRASQFSELVRQQLARTAEGEEKIVALQVANKSNNDNLEMLAQIVQAEAARKNELDTKLDTWTRKKNQEVSVLRGDTTLTKEEITQLRNELYYLSIAEVSGHPIARTLGLALIIHLLLAPNRGLGLSVVRLLLQLTSSSRKGLTGEKRGKCRLKQSLT